MSSQTSLISSTLLRILPSNPNPNPNPGTPAQPTVTLNAAPDLLFAFLHSHLTNLGFKQVPETPENQLESPWPLTPESYSLQYKHDRSSLSFVLKGVVVATKLMVHCVAVEDGSVHSLEYTIPDIVTATFPVTLTVPQSALAETPTLPADENPILPLLKDKERTLEEVLYTFKTRVVDKVAPNLNKDGYQPPSETTASRNEQDRRDLRDYGREGGRDGGWVGGVPDPSFRGGPSRPFPMGGVGGGYGTGDLDLDPFAAAPGLIPPRGGLGGIGGGGMFVGPGHPIFGGGGSGSGSSGPIYGGPGAGGYLPPGAVPPNARFDPIGPFGPAPGYGPGYNGPSGRGGFGGGIGSPFGDGGMGGGGFAGGGVPRGGFGGRGGGRGGRGGFRSGPDNDEMPPPGFDDYYS
ncbi:hypothetical protein BCR33DRAFT_772869 [Rhizoclosmatium globosum]|uniref:Uncharacterized protein n=1 Tax=Rhizoclosmatium globosum TaxID=329046 RepID=A0A1Y2B0R7_9FUNG|nr:hypothetical protein BCR33DRAFT_772869 [Rhizoclosmatium globosum]|eukprot:ORY28411.1 hypothetical protein BCR33DRAFT_772869 [Rhizoclosmatium globosum]